MFPCLSSPSKEQGRLPLKAPIILLVVPVALVQAPNDFFAHLGIAGDRDNHAVLRDDIAVFGLDREVFRTERQAPTGTVPALRGACHTS
jgi:hypothetical protein